MFYQTGQETDSSKKVPLIISKGRENRPKVCRCARDARAPICIPTLVHLVPFLAFDVDARQTLLFRPTIISFPMISTSTHHPPAFSSIYKTPTRTNYLVIETGVMKNGKMRTAYWFVDFFFY